MRVSGCQIIFLQKRQENNLRKAGFCNLLRVDLI
jgi:hypothetical protein